MMATWRNKNLASMTISVPTVALLALALKKEKVQMAQPMVLVVWLPGPRPHDILNMLATGIVISQQKNILLLD
jgi:hypothetical protein